VWRRFAVLDRDGGARGMGAKAVRENKGVFWAGTSRNGERGKLNQFEEWTTDPQKSSPAEEGKGRGRGREEGKKEEVKKGERKRGG
jgi:hypothetical protein